MNTSYNRNRASSLSIIFFFITILSLAVYAEFFRRNDNSAQTHNTYSNIFNSKDFGDISVIEFKNRIGDFKFEKVLKNENPTWKITSPRAINAKSNAVEEIIDQIKTLKIIKIYEKDAINLSNFSLNNPAIKIKLTNNKEESVSYHFGLLNPIDNTTYVTSTDENNVIFQVNSLSRRIETMSLSAFLDSKIFSITPEEIKSFTIFRGNSPNAQLKIQKEKVGWKSSTGRLLEDTQLNKYFSLLGDSSSNLIIDEISEELKEEVKTYLEKPFYRIEFLNNQNKKVVFEVSKLVSNLSNLNIKKRENILIRSSERKNLYLFSKDILPLFQKTQYSFKKLSLKKMFY